MMIKNQNYQNYIDIKLKLIKNQINSAMNPVQRDKEQQIQSTKLQQIKQNNPQEQNQKSSVQINGKRESSQKQFDYYQEFCKLYLANAVLQTHLKQLSIQKSELLGKLHKLEKKAQQNMDGNSNDNTQRKKRIRRSAADIARHYKCSHQNCSKSYGSEGSLNQHIKLKHPDLFKTLNIPESMLLNQFDQDSYSSSKP